MNLGQSHCLNTKQISRVAAVLIGACLVLLVALHHVNAYAAEPYKMDNGYTIVTESVDGAVFDIDKGKALAITSPNDTLIQFTNCVFNISGDTLPVENLPIGFEYKADQTRAKLLVNGGILFTDCTFNVDGATSTTNSYDAIINLYESNGGSVVFENSTVEGENTKGHFMGLYGNVAANFNNSTLTNMNQTGGWTFGQFGVSTMHLCESNFVVKEMKKAGNLTTVYYAADTLKHYDILSAEDSDIDFSFNEGSAFALGHVGLNTSNTILDMNENKSDAVLGGIWKISHGTVNANHNVGTAFKNISLQAQDSMISVIENSEAGITLTADSKLKSTSTNIRSNGLNSLEYSAGDIWLNSVELKLSDCDSAWLGGVAGEGSVSVSGSHVIAQDLNQTGLSGITEPLLGDVKMAGQTAHYVFTNPSIDTPYARGNTADIKAGEKTHDADLFDQFPHKTDIIDVNADTIQEMTEAQLSHHRYDWEDGTLISEPQYNAYGVMRIDSLPLNSFTDKVLASVYIPLINLEFVPNMNSAKQDENVKGMPSNQMLLNYGSTFTVPSEEPTYTDESGTTYTFTGWYKDAKCTEALTNDSILTDSISHAYAGWEKTIAEDNESQDNAKDKNKS